MVGNKKSLLCQGDIIKVALGDNEGHEQAGYRPCLVISRTEFNRVARMAICVPITNTNNGFPLHVSLDGRTKTTGVVLCEHIRSLDVNSRGYKYVESVPQDVLEEVLHITGEELRLF